MGDCLNGGISSDRKIIENVSEKEIYWDTFLECAGIKSVPNGL